MNIEIDAKGQACPKPVIMTKKELDNIEEGTVTTIVDNMVAKENILKLANSLGYEYKVEEGEGEYRIHIAKEKPKMDSSTSTSDKLKEATVVFSSNTMGKGSKELGEILIKSFIYTMTEVVPLPSTLVFYNEGVMQTCKGSEVIEDLKKLEEEGVEILVCGTCLDFFDLKDEIKVGEISNMYTIYEKLKESMKTITIG